MPIELELVTSPTDDARTLIDALESELSKDYPPDQRHGYSIDRIFQPHILFFIARLNREPVGCGGVAFEEGLAEVKRMYVRPDKRGHRIAQTILQRLEIEARARGATRLVLETGDVRHAAIQLYERAGFTRCKPFGPYLTMPPQAIERSVFMEKPLTP
ncbi:MAG TPA: GNAT family N-acetyltransferase [Tepidisphaeraceae bacterium]|jgi:putative acetyltransferase